MTYTTQQLFITDYSQFIGLKPHPQGGSSKNEKRKEGMGGPDKAAKKKKIRGKEQKKKGNNNPHLYLNPRFPTKVDFYHHAKLISGIN